MKRPVAKTVSAYIASYPAAAQVMMKHLRAAIRRACPEATETISYAIPFYQYRTPGYSGRMIYFAAYATHIGVYVVPKHLPPRLAQQVAKYKIAKSTLRFPIGTKIPVTMIMELVKLRMKEIDRAINKAAAVHRR